MYWSVAKTEAQREIVAERHLGLQGFETYLPRIRAVRTATNPRSRFGARVQPLFATYLFVRIVDQWHVIRSTIGIHYLILDGERPAQIGDSYIHDLRSREGIDGLVRLPQPRPEYIPGDRVQITDGPFRDHFAIYEGMLPKERVAVLLGILGAQTRVELSKRAIVKAPLS